jgi:glycosyltransferase involved in cell wall biosynthesis
MNILYLDNYAGNLKYGRSFRPHYLGKEWLKNGHKLLVVGGTYSHLRYKQPEADYEIIDGIEYLWLKTPQYQGNGVKRALSMFSFMFQVFKDRKKILKLMKPDVIICSSVHMLDSFPGLYFKKKTKAKMVFELHDVWPMTLVELGGMSNYHPFVLTLKFAEWFTYKFSDKVVSILPETYKHMKKFGVKEENFCKVPNGIDLEDWENKEDLPESLNNLIESLKGKFVIGYAGSHAISNDLETPILAAKQLEAENISFIFVGDGQEKENLVKFAKESNVTNIHFYGKISKRAVPNFLCKVDANYIGIKQQPLYTYGISPNKIFDYMYAGKPIIQAIDAANNLTKDACCGVSLVGGDVDALVKACIELKNLPEAKLKELGQNGKEYVLANHNYAKLADRFVGFIK